MCENLQLALITVSGPDRPGIIATITGVLANYKADIEDVSMTRLSGNFAMMMAVRSADGGIDAVHDPLVAAGAAVGVHVSFEVIDELVSDEDANVFISAIGPNRVGIVSQLSALLMKHNANINEMTTRLLHRTATPVYVVRIEAAYDGDFENLKSDLGAVGQELGIETRLELLERVDL